MFIIGSQAAAHWGIARRTPVDVDYLYTCGEERPSGDSHAIPQEVYKLFSPVDGYITPGELLTLKASHLPWDVHWWKTLQDVLYYKGRGYSIDTVLYGSLVKYWERVHGKKEHLSLAQSSDSFFNDYVYYPVDHDELHKVVAGKAPPTYTKCLVDGASVEIDRTKFNKLPFAEKVSLFKEEVTVIALERYLLNPYNPVICMVRAYQLALHKTVTSLTKGWASDFMALNIEHFIHPDKSMFYNAIHNVENNMVEELKDLLRAAAKDSGSSAEDVVTGSNLPDGVSLVRQDGGGEGGSEYCTSVFSYKDRYFKIAYSYYSFSGFEVFSDFDGLCEVHPVEKTITVYE